jgi:hypothetical protein
LRREEKSRQRERHKRRRLWRERERQTERGREAMAAAEESFVERGLFGGAITCCIPANFYDVSNIREVPNNQVCGNIICVSWSNFFFFLDHDDDASSLSLSVEERPWKPWWFSVEEKPWKTWWFYVEGKLWKPWWFSVEERPWKPRPWKPWWFSVEERPWKPWWWFSVGERPWKAWKSTNLEVQQNTPTLLGSLSCNVQEAFVDPNRDESIIMELLEFKTDVVDERSSLWFLQDLAIEQGSEQTLVVEPENGITTANVPNLEASIPVNVTVGTLAVAKARQGDDARNLVRVWCIPLKYHVLLLALGSAWGKLIVLCWALYICFLFNSWLQDDAIGFRQALVKLVSGVLFLLFKLVKHVVLLVPRANVVIFTNFRFIWQIFGYEV